LLTARRLGAILTEAWLPLLRPRRSEFPFRLGQLREKNRIGV
jgi:hypothetical protein